MVPNETSDNAHDLLTINEVAVRLKLCPRTITRLNSSGKLPMPSKLGRTLRWNSHELTRWMDYGCPPRVKWQHIWENLRGVSMN